MTTLPTLSRYVMLEIGRHMLLLASIVVGVSMLERLSGLLFDAANGSLPPDVVGRLLWLRTMMSLPSLLPATFYLAIVLGLGRLYQDREVAALEACGVSPLRVGAAVLTLAAVIAVLVGVLSFHVAPGAAARFQEVRRHALENLEVGKLEPRRFYEIGPGGNRVIFAERRAPDGRISDVFVQLRENDALTVLSGKKMTEKIDRVTGEHSLELSGGYRYDLHPGEDHVEITDFRGLLLRVPKEEDEPRLAAPSATSSEALAAAGDPASIAELQWRLAIPVSTIVLALLAIPLSQIEPGQSKYARVLVALLIYLVYHQLLVTGRHWLSDGRLGVLPGLWSLHALFALAALVALSRQISGGSTRSPGQTGMLSAPSGR